MTEAIRLVVWDLDDTFWQGTLTEGGMIYRQDVHDIVVRLAERGILSSICSKNDFGQIRNILMAKGIWDFFVFPSIDWSTKGPRLVRMVERVQLRPPTILFIDDNALNRAEAAHYVPGIQIADETFIADMLSDPRLVGKDDTGLTRLAQYKLLERRQTDQEGHGDNTEFLRASNITVAIDFNVEAQLDRAVELINRTNQLNFTKVRLPEQVEFARSRLLEELNRPNVQAGLVKVTDAYGDYGFTGFYLLHVHSQRLIHFCFSCRTLGMGVERWLFNKLGCPAIAISGDVLANLHGGEPTPDWISQGDVTTRSATRGQLGRVFVRGGCEMQSVAHYLSLDADELVGEFPFDRHGLPVPVHHSVFLRAAIDGYPATAIKAASSVGLEPEDFTSKMARHLPGFDLYVFSFWADAHYAVYQDRQSPLLAPFGVHGLNNGGDLRKVPSQELEQRISDLAGRAIVAEVCGRFDCLTWAPAVRGASGKTLVEENLLAIFGAIPESKPVFVLLGCEEVDGSDGQRQVMHHFRELNRLTRLAAEEFPNVHLMAPEEFFESSSDVHDATHYARHVYYRMHRRIVDTVAAG